MSERPVLEKPPHFLWQTLFGFARKVTHPSEKPPNQTNTPEPTHRFCEYNVVGIIGPKKLV